LVKLTAPLVAGGNTFQKWTLNGSDFSFSPEIEIVIDGITKVLSVIYVSPIPCLHPKTLVSVIDRSTGKGKEVCINTIRAGDMVIDLNGEPVKVVKNMRFGSTNSYVLIKKGSLTKDRSLPSSDIYIRKEHPVLINGKEIEARNLKKLVGTKMIKDVKLEYLTPVWSLATKKKTYVMMSGIPVGTWSDSDPRLIKFKHESF